MMKTKLVNEAIKHLGARSDDEIISNIESSTDMHILYNLLSKNKSSNISAAIIERMIALDTRSFIHKFLNTNYKYSEKSKQILKKYVKENFDKVFIDNVIKIAKILQDKDIMQQAIKKLKSRSETIFKKDNLRTEINKVCKKFWEDKGIKFYEIIDLDINIANIHVNKLVQNAEGVICLEAYLISDGNGNISNVLRGYTIKNGNLSSQEYNLLSKSYNIND